jgi:serine/alanine adding enzyme
MQRYMGEARVSHMEVLELRKKDEKEWDAFVRRQDDATFFHLTGWKNVIERTYKHKAYYLIAREDDEIKGILPLVLMKSMFFGKKIISVPFVYCGGVCAESSDAANSLTNKAITITKNSGVDFLELRNCSEDVNLPATNYTFVTSILELSPDSEDVFRKMSKNKRKTIRKAEKQNLKAEWGEDVKSFYRLYAHNMRDLGTPVHSYNFFYNILHNFPNNSKILLAKRGEGVLYAALFLFYKDMMMDFMSSTLGKYRKYYPTDFGIWTAIKYACENGYRYFDFARSIQGSSNQEFKKRWNTETKQLYYQYYLNTSNIPDYDISNKKYQTFIRMWKKVPVPVAKVVGPRIRRNIP